MTDITRTASDHLLHSTPATFDIDTEFVRDMEHARKAGQAVDVIEAHMMTLSAPQLDEQCAALLAQHNAEATERKARIERNGGDWFSRHGYPRDSKSQTGYGVSID